MSVASSTVLLLHRNKNNPSHKHQLTPYSIHDAYSIAIILLNTSLNKEYQKYLIHVLFGLSLWSLVKNRKKPSLIILYLQSQSTQTYPGGEGVIDYFYTWRIYHFPPWLSVLKSVCVSVDFSYSLSCQIFINRAKNKHSVSRSKFLMTRHSGP